MTDHTAQPLTEAELAEIRDLWNEYLEAQPETATAAGQVDLAVAKLLAEVNRLRSELDRLRRELAEMKTDRDKYQNWYDDACDELAEAYRSRNEEN